MGHHIFKQIHPCAIAKNRDLKDLENRESFLKKLICRFVNVPFGSLAGTSLIRHALSIAVDILWPLLMILSGRGHLKPSKWPVIGALYSRSRISVYHRSETCLCVILARSQFPQTRHIVHTTGLPSLTRQMQSDAISTSRQLERQNEDVICFSMSKPCTEQAGAFLGLYADLAFTRILLPVSRSDKVHHMLCYSLRLSFLHHC